MEKPIKNWFPTEEQNEKISTKYYKWLDIQFRWKVRNILDSNLRSIEENVREYSNTLGDYLSHIDKFKLWKHHDETFSTNDDHEELILTSLFSITHETLYKVLLSLQREKV